MTTNECGLTTTPAEATIYYGTFPAIRTPKIINILVSRKRGNPVGTAEVSFTHDGSITDTEPTLVIKFWGDTVFTGIVRRVDISPSFNCGELIYRIQAEDFLSKLQNRTITRRQKLPGLGPMAFISSIYKRTTVGFDSARDVYNINSSNSPIDLFTGSINPNEMTQLTQAGENNMMGSLHPVTKVADNLNGANNGLPIHDHASLQAGGPAVAVYGVK